MKADINWDQGQSNFVKWSKRPLWSMLKWGWGLVKDKGELNGRTGVEKKKKELWDLKSTLYPPLNSVVSICVFLGMLLYLKYD